MSTDSGSEFAQAIGLPNEYDARYLTWVMSGKPLWPQQLEMMTGDHKTLAKVMNACPSPTARLAAYNDFVDRHPDPEEFRRRLRQYGMDEVLPRPPVDETPRPPVDETPRPPVDDMPASGADLTRSAEGVRWFWKGWVARGRISGLAGAEGTGKTRFGLDLAKRAYQGLAAPDGQPLEVAAGSKSLWICGDGHQDELIGTAREMGLPPEAILFNAPLREPYGGVDLDDPEDLLQLERFLERSGAPLVFVDTLTNATRRDLCRQSDVKSLLTPLMEIARGRDVAVILMLHVSREGQALGRRVKGLTRTLLHLECPDPDHASARLRLWVEKSFTLKPPALGVTMSDSGNLYDTNPPGRGDRPQVGRPADKIGKATEFLLLALAEGDRRACDLLADWQARGEGKSTLFRARDALAESGRLVVDQSSKFQIWHLVKAD